MRISLKWPDLVLLVLAPVIFAYGLYRLEPQPPAPFVTPEAAPALAAESPALFRTYFASSDVDDFTHAPSVAATPNGGLIAVWFAGSREGAADVNIRSARFDPILQQWTPEQNLISRPTSQVALGRHIRKLGNPVVALAPNNRLWLFYVSVSVGGWAGSAINAMHSDDGGQSWSPPRRLITSPVFNVSTLVRNAPVFHQDGSIGLPVYHEFIGKFAEYLRLDSEGRVINKHRISRWRYSLQPSVAPLSADSALVFLRNAGAEPAQVLASMTTDRGQNWSRPRPVAAWNPNASLAALSLDAPDAGVLLVLNNLQDKRFRLSLYRTGADLESWRRVAVLDESPDPEGKLFERDAYQALLRDKFLAVGATPDAETLERFMQHIDRRVCKPRFGCEFEYEYPYFIRTADGLFHVVYAWNNSFIKHVVFNRAWLEAQP